MHDGLHTAALHRLHVLDPHLDWHGVRQYVARQPTLQLYGWQSGHLPAWFSDRFPAEYHRKRLFDEKPDALRHAAPFADGKKLVTGSYDTTAKVWDAESGTCLLTLEGHTAAVTSAAHIGSTPPAARALRYSSYRDHTLSLAGSHPLARRNSSLDAYTGGRRRSWRLQNALAARGGRLVLIDFG